MAHALPSDLGLDHFHSALVTDNPPVLHAFILATVTLPILDRPKNPCTEESIPFRLVGTIVNGLWLFNLPIRPGSDLLRGGDTDPDRIKGDRFLRFLKKTIDTFQGFLLAKLADSSAPP